ncbi:hypothetical protein [Salana multivorans]
MPRRRGSADGLAGAVDEADVPVAGVAGSVDSAVEQPARRTAAAAAEARTAGRVRRRRVVIIFFSLCGGRWGGRWCGQGCGRAA